MRDRIKVVLSLAVILTAATPTQAQDFWVQIESNRLDANVYADSLWLGKASIRLFLVPDGTGEISLVPAPVDAWSIPAIKRVLTAGPGRRDTLQLEMRFPFYYSLESIPSSASVYLSESGERRRLGETPVLFSLEDPASGEFIFDRSGFLSRRVTPGTALWNRHLVALDPAGAESTSSAEVSLNVESQRKKWIDYLAVGTAVTAGVLAIHFKTKANNRYARYEMSGNPELRDEIHRLDVLSGVSLGAMQLGLGIFALRFVF